MKKTYIQPKLMVHHLDSGAAVMAGSFKSHGGDYTGDDDYHGTNPNVKPDTDENDGDIIGLPGGDE